ncbi:MAG: biotin--[acetyl-CoA-carboxylase] ligase [Mycobacteriales bacterium]
MFSDLDRPPLRGLRGGPLLPGGRWRVRVVERTASTNADLAADARASRAAPGAVLVAEEQTAGRGRQGRSWVSPPRAGLTLSVLLAAAADPWVPLLAGVALARVVAAAGVPAMLKWPNDVLAGGRKVAGLLAEVVGPDLVVIGVGLNVTTRREELPTPGATSLALEGANVTDRVTLLRAFLRELEGDRVPADYRALCATLGRRVEVTLPGGQVASGQAEAVDDRGRLVVDGTAYTVGDVVHVR